MPTNPAEREGLDDMERGQREQIIDCISAEFSGVAGHLERAEKIVAKLERLALLGAALPKNLRSLAQSVLDQIAEQPDERLVTLTREAADDLARAVLTGIAPPREPRPICAHCDKPSAHLDPAQSFYPACDEHAAGAAPSEREGREARIEVRRGDNGWFYHAVDNDGITRGVYPDPASAELHVQRLAAAPHEGREPVAWEVACPACNGLGEVREAVQAWGVSGAPAPTCPHCDDGVLDLAALLAPREQEPPAPGETWDEAEEMAAVCDHAAEVGRCLSPGSRANLRAAARYIRAAAPGEANNAEAWLRRIVNHWFEFGPEHNLNELMDHADTFLRCGPTLPAPTGEAARLAEELDTLADGDEIDAAINPSLTVRAEAATRAETHRAAARLLRGEHP